MRRFSPSRDDRSERAKNSAAEISRKIVAGQPEWSEVIGRHNLTARAGRSEAVLGGPDALIAGDGDTALSKRQRIA